MNSDCAIGIDLGGTNIRGGVVCGDELTGMQAQRINPHGTVDEVLQQLFQLTDRLLTPSVKSIGIGVPGLVDEATGIVYDVINIPSWKEVALQQKMQERYNLPALLNNDANCFALGEYYFGKGRGHASMIGLTIGTGLGTGIIIQEKLYTGASGGAGEFGMIDYLDQCYEYYASGQFFRNVYGIEGEEVFKRATGGEAEAIAMYGELGMHLGKAIKMIQYALDVDLIVLGGSVRHAYRWFQKRMWEQIETTAYQRSAKRLQIAVSEQENSGLLGAAALYRNAQITK
ncbi:ROK family protein [Flavisolibacter nicotianae]|uniref:ROK family protein n=1 Tax=Flavisolibacter nicotianae TaxID=2364882 RepID=UPI001F09E15D|nr:ROK family protein [Flavisolibacter nicotianae]